MVPSEADCRSAEQEQELSNKERASRQTHTQGNSKNKEGKQHRNKTQMENTRSVTT
jgi:hypothetical protein